MATKRRPTKQSKRFLLTFREAEGRVPDKTLACAAECELEAWRKAKGIIKVLQDYQRGEFGRCLQLEVASVEEVSQLCANAAAGVRPSATLQLTDSRTGKPVGGPITVHRTMLTRVSEVAS